MTDIQPKNNDQRAKLAVAGSSSAREARAQAEAYDSLFANQKIVLNDGSTMEIPPHPDFGMLDDDRMEAYEELVFESESYDREPDIYIPEQHLDSGLTLPADTQQGALKRPFRIEGKLVKPPWTVRVAMAALGENEYARLKAGGRSAADVWRIWGKQGLEVKLRQENDPKSVDGPLDLASVSSSNSE